MWTNRSNIVYFDFFIIRHYHARGGWPLNNILPPMILLRHFHYAIADYAADLSVNITGEWGFARGASLCERGLSSRGIPVW